MYALIKNNAVSVYPYTIAQFAAANPDVSLPMTPTEAQLNEQGIYTVYPTPAPSYDWITQGIRELTPEKTAGQWFQVWEVYSLTPSEVAANQGIARQQNKDQATQLLQATDWTATVDINNPQYSNPYLGNQPEFLSYRSQVRQIAVNPPITVTSWPSKPSELWIPA